MRLLPFVGLVWTPVAVIGAISGPIAIILGFFVWRSRPDRWQNRWLGWALMLEGVSVGAGAGWMYLTDDPAHTYALQAMTYGTFTVAWASMLCFFGTLGVASSKPLRIPAVRWALWVVAAGVAALITFVPSVMLAGVQTGGYAPWDALHRPEVFRWFLLAFVLLPLYGLIVTVNALLSSSGRLRKQARMYFAAFVVRDTAFAITFAGMFGLYEAPFPGFAGVFMPALGQIIYVPILAYGILRHQLFDIDIKLKVGVRRGFVVAPFAVAFFVATETLEGVLPFDSYIVGLVAAGALSLLFVPLRRAADRMADALMPGVDDTPDYREDRAEELYAAAWEAAQVDGRITAGERSMLDRLAVEFGLTDSRRKALESG